MMISSNAHNIKQEAEETIEDYIRNTVGDNKFDNLSIPVFLSSTKDDLQSERYAITFLIQQMGLIPIAMEEFGARPESPLDTCLGELDDAKIFVLVIGMRYGSPYTCDNGNDGELNGKSYTEIEYDRALKNENIRILAYCIDEEKALIHPIYVDNDANAKKLIKFKDKIKKNHHIVQYASTQELISAVFHDISYQIKLLTRNNKSPTPSQKTDNSKQLTIAANTDTLYTHETLHLTGMSTYLDSDSVYLYLTKISPNNTSFTENEFFSIGKNGEKYRRIPVLNDFTWATLWNPWDTFTDREVRNKLLPDGGMLRFIVSPYPIKTEPIHDYREFLIKLSTPFLTATSNSSPLIPGVETYVRGSALTKQPSLLAWLCTKDKLVDYFPIPIQNDEYTYIFPYELLKSLEVGMTYLLILQMPSTSKYGDVRQFYYSPTQHGIGKVRKDNLDKIESESMILLDANNSTPGLADKICNLIDSTENDIYVRLAFVRQEPEINNFVINQKAGKLEISGQTNLPIDTQLSVEITTKEIPQRAIFAFNQLRTPRIFSTMKVIRSGQRNGFSVIIATPRISVGEYTVVLTLLTTGKKIFEKSINL